MRSPLHLYIRHYSNQDTYCHYHLLPLYLNNQKYYCLDDYVDYLIPLEKGEVIKLVGIYGPYAYVIKDNEIGWVKYRYLKKVN